MYINQIKKNIINLWTQTEILKDRFNDAGFNDHRVWMENVAIILLTCIYDAKFVNLNKETPNAKGFDLSCERHSLLVQVTTSQKLSQKKLSNFKQNSKDYPKKFKFVLYRIQKRLIENEFNKPFVIAKIKF